MLSVQSSPERQAFEQFLIEVKALMKRKNIKSPTGFISYAWEAAGSAELKGLHAWLTQFQEDFARLGINAFFDIKNMNGNMRECMRLISEKDFVILIGTPRFKGRAVQDALYLLPPTNTIDFKILPSTGHAVVLIENQNTVHFIQEHNNNQFLVSQMSSQNLNLSEVEWIQEPGYKRAKVSKAVNEVIEEAISHLATRNIRRITNVAYEFGLTLDRAKRAGNQSFAFIPLLYQGDFNTSFPEDVLAETLIRDCRDANRYYQTFASLSNPLGLIPAVCPSLQNDEDYRALVTAFNWRFDDWKAQQQAKPSEELSLYIPARGDLSAECCHPQPMEKHIQDFLHQKSAKVLLLLGNSGSGKSLFGRYLSREVWQSDITPLWISLPALQNPKTQATAEGLSLEGVPAIHHASFKQKPLLIILDAYDEVKDLGNLYDSNHLEAWNAKVIITCRPEYLTAKNLDTLFKPKNSELWTRYIAPFSTTEITAYLEKYVTLQQPRWNVATYQKNIDRLPVLKELIQTPFLLRMAADVLPDIFEQYQENEQLLLLTRRALYEKFIDRWFLRHIIRWKEQRLEDQSNHFKLSLLDEGLELVAEEQQEWDEKRIAVLRDYAETLAHRLYSAQIDAVSTNASYPWVKTLFDKKPRIALIRSACPLKKTGKDTYSFIHKSLLEYLVTPQILKTLEMLNQPLTPNTIQFLKDAIQERPELQPGFWAIIEASKQDTSQALAASNAITVLNAAHISFSGKNLQNIRIPGANLTGAILDNTNLENADLSNVTFTGAWLHGTHLKNACLLGSSFGEYPALLLEDQVEHCYYSPDGQLLVVAVNKQVQLYDPSTRALIRTLESHMSRVTSISFSPDGRLLASGSEEEGIKLWYVGNGTLYRTLNESAFGSHITSVCFSSNGKLLASTGHREEGIKLWDIRSGELQKILGSETFGSISFSPTGKLLASVSKDYTIKLWDVESGELKKTLRGHAYDITSIQFSPDGKLLASGGSAFTLFDDTEATGDSTIRLWNVENGTLQRTFEGHAVGVMSVQFSPNGKYLASGGMDNMVKLWMVEGGHLQQTFQGHTDLVNSVHFSPDGKTLASASCDNTVRLWKIGNHLLRQPFHYTVDNLITSGNFSSDGKLFASGVGRTVELWSLENGALLKTLEGHTDIVRAVRFSGANNELLASGGDDRTVRLWLMPNGQLKEILTTCNNVDKLQFSPDGKLLVSGGGNFVELWSMPSGQLKKRIQVSTSSIHISTDICFIRSGKVLAFGTSSGVVELWDIEKGTLQQLLRRKWDSKCNIPRITNICFSPDEKILAWSDSSEVNLSATGNGDLQTLKKLTQGDISAFQFSPDGKFLVIAGGYRDNTLKLWNGLNSEQAENIYSIKLTSYATSLSFANNEKGTFLATTHGDFSVRYWQLITLSNKPYLRLIWSSVQNTLMSQDANIEGVEGLSADNANLLKQRETIGEPILTQPPLRWLFFSNVARNQSATQNFSSQANDRIQVDAGEKRCIIS